MRPVRPLQSLVALVMPLLGAIAVLAQAGCVDNGNQSRFYTYCDNTGCFQCDGSGCSQMQGRPPGAMCKNSAECAAGCYCGADSKCAEAGFCDRPGDCAKGYVCNVKRHSCEPDTGTQPPKSCRAAVDCTAGSECNNATCRPTPVPPNHCVFDRQCGQGGQCIDGLCNKACQNDTTCGTGRACLNKRCVVKPVTPTSCGNNAQCGAGQTCINGSCHGGGCTKDSACQAINGNDICTSGLCRPDERPVPECTFNADCGGGGKECINAQCRTFCLANSDCAQCTDGTVCSAAYCMTAREAAPQCKLGPDCNGGTLHCIDGACSQ